MPKLLLTGFFSTIGDIECLEAVEQQLNTIGYGYDVAPLHPHIRERIEGAVDLNSVDSDEYSHVVVICGPMSRGQFEKFGLQKLFDDGLVFVGVNLSMLQPLTDWNPFAVLLERDSDCGGKTDLSFSVETGDRPVVSVCFIDFQAEYGQRQRHSRVRGTVEAYLGAHDIAVVSVDTRWPRTSNLHGHESPAHIKSILGRTDLLITNRLHGLVFGLKAGIPVIAIDGISGGAKLTAQAQRLDWPMCINVEDLSHQALTKAIAWCKSDEARSAVSRSNDKARRGTPDLVCGFAHAMTIQRKPRPQSVQSARNRRGRLIRAVMRHGSARLRRLF